MTGGLFGLLVFAFLAAAALFSLWLHPRLPEHYRSAETTSNLRLGMGVIATITAVVLGLLISSVKGSFDLASRDVQALAADLIVLDRTLHFYGPNAAHARGLLARYTERVLEGTWPSGGQAPTVDDQVAEDLLNQTELTILSLQPDPQEPDFKERCFPAHSRGPDPVAGTDLCQLRLQCSAQRHDGLCLVGVCRLGRRCDLSHSGNRWRGERAHRCFQRSNPARACRHATVTPARSWRSAVRCAPPPVERADASWPS
jgi:hypothetical protein